MLATVRQLLNQPGLAHQARVDAFKVQLVQLDAQLASHPSDAQLWTDRAFLDLRLDRDRDAAGDFGKAAQIDQSVPRISNT